MRRADLLIQQFFRDGKMTAELGELFLESDLVAVATDTILEVAAYAWDDQEGRAECR